MIEFDEHVPERRHLDLTPLIDCVFLLLIFFLLTSVYVKPVLPLDLPEAETAVAGREPPLTIAIKPDGSILVNNRPVAAGELYTAVAANYRNVAKRELHLLADKSVAFGKVIEVIDIAKQAGAVNISVVTEPKK